MKHLFVQYDLALKLKEKGFNEKCFGCYYDNAFEIMLYFDQQMKGEIYSAPLYQQVIDWLRDKHNISVLIEIGTQEYSYLLYDVIKNNRLSGMETLKYNGTYYDTLTKAIEEALKLI